MVRLFLGIVGLLMLLTAALWLPPSLMPVISAEHYKDVPIGWAASGLVVLAGLCGAAVGFDWGRHTMPPLANGGEAHAGMTQRVVVGIGCLLGALVLLSALLGQISFARAALVIAFSVLAVVTGWLAIERASANDIGVQSHWGGLGGGLGGWRISPVIVLSVLALGFAGAAVSVVFEPPKPAPATATADKPAPGDGKGGAGKLSDGTGSRPKTGADAPPAAAPDKP